MKMRLARRFLSVLLVLSLAVSTAFALPSAVRQGSALSPQAMYERAETLAYYVRTLHIDSGRNDNPLLTAYQKLTGSGETLSANRLRRALIDLFAADDGNFETFLDTMLDCYDPYSNLFTWEEYESAYPDSEDYTGIGFTYHACGPFLAVTTVYADSPAGKAGVRPGDRIVKIAGQDLRALTDDERDALMEQYRGVEFPFSVLRAGETELLSFSITPGEVAVPFIEYELLENGAGILAINRFEGDLFATDLAASIDAFRAAGIDSLIIDLRDNPGGGVTQLLTALDAFVPEKDTLLFTELHRGKRTPHFSSGGGYDPGEIYILVGGGTASSAEIFAGVMTDLGLAVTVGSETYGKGRGQSGFAFGEEILMLSVSEVELPVTGCYDGAGLTPDIPVEDGGAVFTLASLEPLSVKTAVSAASSSSAILALEQRLFLTGFLFEEPDGVFDAATEDALAGLYAVLGRQASKTASPAALSALAELTARMDGAALPAEEDAVLNAVCARIGADDAA